MKRILAAVVAGCLILLAGCSGSPHHGRRGAIGPVDVRVAAACPAGRSFMGCAAPKPSSGGLKVGRPPAGCKFPDVSSYQGHPNWASVRSWQLAAHCTPGAVFKLGEYVIDPDAGYNAGSLHRLGMAAVGYWFVRRTGCAHEAGQIAAVARQLGLHVVVLDMEVPEAAGYAPCLSAPLKHAGLAVVIYTGPGTWPGGSSAGLPVWVADYGPSSAPSMFGERPIAWQETDGRYGYPVYVPGIGSGDVSVDYGLLKLAAPKPPKPRPSRRQIARWKRAAAASERVYVRRDCPSVEHNIVWYSHHQHQPHLSRRRRALAASRRVYKREHCAVFAQRVRYFERRARS